MLSEITHSAVFTLEAGETFYYRDLVHRSEVFVTSFAMHWTGHQGPAGLTLHGVYTAPGHTHQSVTVEHAPIHLMPEHVRRAVIRFTH